MYRYLFLNKHLINVRTNEENIIQNFFRFIEGGAGAGPSHRLRLRPKSTGYDQLRSATLMLSATVQVIL